MKPLKACRAVALLGGAALYHGGRIGFRLRNVGTLNRERVVAALLAGRSSSSLSGSRGAGAGRELRLRQALRQRRRTVRRAGRTTGLSPARQVVKEAAKQRVGETPVTPSVALDDRRVA